MSNCCSTNSSDTLELVKADAVACCSMSESKDACCSDATAGSCCSSKSATELGVAQACC